MDAGDLRIFEAVARLGSMNKAALELNTVQSNVTARIRTLEEELGGKLFIRTNRGVTLTLPGQRLLPYATRVSRLLDDARREVADLGPLSGPLAIGSLETTAALRLSSLLADFATTYPAVDLSLRTGTSCELIEQVLDRRVDGAFVCGPVEHGDLLAETFFQEELVFLTAPSVASLTEMLGQRDLRIVVLRAGCSYRFHLEAWLARHGIVGVRALEFGTLEAIVGCVGAGLGVTLLPRALVGSLCQQDRVAVHPLPPGEGAVETVFVRHREAYASRALRAFLDLARSGLSRASAAE